MQTYHKGHLHEQRATRHEDAENLPQCAIGIWQVFEDFLTHDLMQSAIVEWKRQCVTNDVDLESWVGYRDLELCGCKNVRSMIRRPSPIGIVHFSEQLLKILLDFYQPLIVDLSDQPHFPRLLDKRYRITPNLIDRH